MLDNITEMATSLQDFVKTFYAATYAQVGNGLIPYEDLMYMGLQNSTFYQEDVVSKGLTTSFQANWAKLNEGGKCQD